MTEKRDIVERLEIVARRMDSTIARGEPAMLGTKHPEEVREAAAEILRLRASLADAYETAAKVADKNEKRALKARNSAAAGYCLDIAAAIRALKETQT